MLEVFVCLLDGVELGIVAEMAAVFGFGLIIGIARSGAVLANGGC